MTWWASTARGTTGRPYGHAPADKLATQVAGRIEAEIARRGWPAGQSLGSEVDLREQYGVSRAVLREAVRLVEHHQVARMQRGPGGGLLIVTPDAGPATRASVIYLEYLGASIEDLVAARLLLEPLATALAAERITEDGITRLRGALAAEPDRNSPGMWSHDPLNVVLGELSGNSVLRLFIDVLTRLTDRYAYLGEQLASDELAAARARSQQWRASIVEAVIAGDAARARTRMSDYLDRTAAWLHEHRDGPGAGPGPPADTSQEKLAEVVAARIHEDIVRQGWPVGQVLGSETGLLDRYQISRAVFREALRLLEYHAVARDAPRAGRRARRRRAGTPGQHRNDGPVPGIPAQHRRGPAHSPGSHRARDGGRGDRPPR